MKETYPAPRTETVRRAIHDALVEEPLTAHELSFRVGVPERDVAEHLESIERSAKRHGERFIVEPARCAECEFVFRKRERLKAPSRCPVCKSERIHPPSFRLETS